MTNHRTITGILDKTTFRTVHGSRMPWDDRPRYCMSNETFIHRNNNREFMGWRSWSTKQYNEHLESKRTLYFMGDGSRDPERPLTMFAFDIDCKDGIGTKDGAKACASHLKSKWPQIAFEVSTGGVGQHGYGFFKKDGHKSEEINTAYAHLDKWLKQECQPFVDRGQISGIEIKGTCPVIKRDEYGKIVSSADAKFGYLCKMPRTLTLAELKTSMATPFKYDELNALEIRPQQLPELRFPTKKEHAGSCSDKIFPPETGDEIKSLESFWMDQTSGEELPTSNKYRKVSANDGAGLLTILQFAMANPNEDQSMPVARIMSIWKVFYDEGWMESAPCHHKVKAFREWLNAQGCIHWIDENYVFSDDGTGQAMKWHLSAALVNAIAEHLEDGKTHSQGGGTFMGRGTPVIDTNPPRKPIGRPKLYLIGSRQWEEGCELEKRLMAA